MSTRLAEQWGVPTIALAALLLALVGHASVAPLVCPASVSPLCSGCALGLCRRGGWRRWSMSDGRRERVTWKNS